MKRLKALLLVLLLAMGYGFAAWAAPFADFGGSEPQFRNFTTREGLPSNRVRDVCQDSVGFIWMATDGGLVRFDGRKFKPYTLLPHDEGADAEQFVMALGAGKGELFAGTDSHVYRYDNPRDRFVQIPLIDDKGVEIQGLVRSLAVDHKGHLWVSVASKGVWKVDVTHPDAPQTTHFSFPDQKVFNGRVFADNHNRIWVATNAGEGELYVFNPTMGRFDPYLVTMATTGEKADTRAFAIGESAGGSIWLGLWDGSLLKIDTLTGRATKVGHTGAYHTRSLLVLPSETGDRLLMGSDTGLTQIEPETAGETPRLARTLAPDELNPHSLAGAFVYGLIRDREGGYWISTFHGGVSYLPPAMRTFSVYRPSAYRNSVRGAVVSAFGPTDDGMVYVGTEDGGLSVYRCEDDHFYTGVNKSSEIASQKGMPQLDIHALAFQKPYLWIGSYGKGIHRLDTRDGSTRAYLPPLSDDGRMPERSCYAMLVDSRGTLWAASPQSFTRFDEGRDAFVFVRSMEANSSNIVEDKAGNLWISTNGSGALKFNPAQDVWKSYRHVPGEPSLPHNHVNYLLPDKEGRLWAATVGGLALYNAEADRFEPVALSGWGGGELCGIVEADGVLWIASTQGLLRFNPSTGQTRLLTELDGLPSNYMMQAACGTAPDGRIYFGTSKGFFAFNPRQIGERGEIAPVVITGVEIQNVPLEATDWRFPRGIGEDALLSLGPDDRTVNLEFASLSYLNPMSTRYRYRLEGFDSDWVEAAPGNRATYTNLPSGDYIFRVQAANDLGEWADTGAELLISVAPPWYRSWWMICIYVLLGAALAYGAYWLVNRRAQIKRRDEIKAIRAEREKEVFNAKLQFFTIVAHEIRTPVSLIIGPLEKVMSATQSLAAPTRRDLDIIDRNAQRLLTLVNQLLDFKKAEQNIMSVTYRSTPVIAQIETVAVRFRPTIEQAGGTFICRYPSQEFTADVDPEALNKLVSNLLNNARKFTKNQVSLSVSQDAGKGTFTVEVADNGPGIAPEHRKKIFKPFFQVESSVDRSDTKGGTGLGLSIVKRIVEAHKGQVEIDSNVGENSFTRFIVTLPLHQEGVKDNVVEKSTDQLPEAPSEVDAKETETGVAEGSKPRLLVVDDNPEMTSFLTDALEDEYAVVSAADGREALEMLQKAEAPFSMVVSDWMMPRMNGIELCQSVRGDQNTSHLPFILLTAKTDNLSRIEGMDCGADYYIEKPFSTSFLRACIRNLVRRRQQTATQFATEPLTPVKTLTSTPVDDSFMTRLTAIIEANFTDPSLTVDFLASQMNMSRSGFYAKIKTLADVSPNDLIEISRLKRAAILLAEGNYLIGEVATLVGFNSPSYFSTRFKARFSLTPAAFAAQSKS